MAPKSEPKRGKRTLRIIAGQWRGRRLSIPARTKVRPTPDRVRETLFNWLGDYLAGAKCLDLYAGTGILGLEALSRGADEAWFVEQDSRLTEPLASFVAVLGADAHVITQDAQQFLDRGPATRFDIVFVDPPYDVPLGPIVDKLPPHLAERALIYVERPLRQGLPDTAWAQWLKKGRAGAVCYGLATMATGAVAGAR